MYIGSNVTDNTSFEISVIFASYLVSAGKKILLIIKSGLLGWI